MLFPPAELDPAPLATGDSDDEETEIAVPTTLPGLVLGIRDGASVVPPRVVKVDIEEGGESGPGA